MIFSLRPQKPFGVDIARYTWRYFHRLCYSLDLFPNRTLLRTTPDPACLPLV